MEKISVVVPAYNAESSIRRCLDSLAMQRTNGLFDYEVLVVDDGSTDAAPIIDRYSVDYNNIKVYHIPNGGPSAARKYAIDHSESDYIAFCDSDDYVDNDFLLTLYKILKENNADFSMICAYINDRETPAQKNSANSLSIWNQQEAIAKFIEHRHLNGILWTNLFKRSLFEGLQWNHSMRIFEDGFLIWQILSKIEKVAKVSVRKYHYMFNPESLTNISYNYGHYKATCFLLDRIVSDCSRPSLIAFRESALSMRYGWFANSLYNSVKSDYPESAEADREMVKIIRKGGLKRLLNMKSPKAIIRTAILACSPRLVRFLFKYVKR